jgi:hypothetical protein
MFTLVGKIKLIFFVSVNWFWNYNTTRPIVIYVFQLSGSTITWLSKWQWIVTLSSIKVEYVEQLLKVWKSPCGCKTWGENQDWGGGVIQIQSTSHLLMTLFFMHKQNTSRCIINSLRKTPKWWNHILKLVIKKSTSLQNI